MHSLMEAAGSEGGGAGGTAGGSGAAPGVGAADAPVGGVPKQGGADGAQGGAAAPASALAAGAGEGGGDPLAWLPEKYRVLGEDKALNLEASARKVAEAHRSLEKRMGEVGLPPESPDGYKPEGLPETVNVEELMKDEGTKAFLKRMHAKGLTNAQVSEVLAFGLAEWAPKLLADDSQKSTQETLATLKQSWTDDAAMQLNLQHSWKASAAIAQKVGVSMEEIERRYGNDPLFIRMMAAIGPEIGEDGNVNAGSGGASTEAQTIRDLESSEAYRNSKHPQHEAVSAKVRAYYQRRYPGNAL